MKRFTQVADIPLYTHPIPNETLDTRSYLIGRYDGLREVTDEEIREVADSVCHTWKKNGVGELYMTDFARAILRKAQEK